MTFRLDPLGPQHAAAILDGQDDLLAQEIAGRRWDAASIAQFVERASRWQENGPIQEFAALEETGSPILLGGGGLHRLAPGIERGQAAMTYWVLEHHRRRGWGHMIAQEIARHAGRDDRLDQLVLFIAPHNVPSQAVARAVGARQAGALERHPADAARCVGRWILDLR